MRGWAFHRIRARRFALPLVVVVLALGGATLFAGSASSAPTATTSTEAAGTDQRFVPNVNDAFRDLSSRADALGFRQNGAPRDDVCKHYQGLARNDADDGTRSCYHPLFVAALLKRIRLGL